MKSRRPRTMVATVGFLSGRNEGFPDELSLTDSTLRGSFWISTQWFLNKIVTAGATLLIAYFLSPDDYGLAATALAIAGFLCIMPPKIMGDILIAHPRHFELLVPTVRRLAWCVGLISTFVMLISIPVVLQIYESYPSLWLAGLLAILAFGPLFNALFVVPVSNLRHTFDFRRIAIVDGVVQLAATLLSVGLAASGGRAASLVLPQILNQAARALCYIRMGTVRTARRFHRKITRLLMRNYLVLAGAAYVHSTLVRMEIIILGYLAGGYQAGLFGFAFMLAVQGNRIILIPIEIVLQPVLGRLQKDPTRQREGFLRALRMLAAVCVPFSLLQIVLAEPFFRLLLPEKWQPAVPVFQVLCLMQVFYFAITPSLSCLKAQRRFEVFFIWQGVQLILSLPLYWFAVRQGGALGVAIASTLMWSISAPVVVWLCIKVGGRRQLGRAIYIFARPWLIGLLVFVPGYLLMQWLNGWGRFGDVVAVLVAGPMMFIIALLVTRLVDLEFRSISDRMLSRVINGIKREQDE